MVWAIGLAGGQLFAQSSPPPLFPTSEARALDLPLDPPASGAPTQVQAQFPFPTGGSSDLLLTGGPGQGVGRAKPSEQDVDFTVAIELPGPNRLFKRESEAEFFHTLREEAKSRAGSGRVFFPEYTRSATGPFQPRSFPPMFETVEPLVLQHGRLFFEQPNFERQGWDLGILTPAVNLGVFYYDIAALPYHYWSQPCERCDSSAGKCLPGDPTPLYLYRERFSLTGVAGQAATVIGGFFVFP